MNGKTDRQSTSLALLFFSIAMTLLMIFEYSIYNGYVNPGSNMITKGLYQITYVKNPNLFLYNRIFFPFILLLGMALSNMRKKDEKPDTYKHYIWPVLLFYIPLIYGYMPSEDAFSYKYNNFLIVLLFIVLNYFLIKYSRFFIKSPIQETDDPLNAASCVDSNPDMSIEFPVTLSSGKKTILRVHSAKQGIWVQGGAGAGKSASMIEPALFQFAMKGFGMYVYDFKGSESPLSKTVYNSIQHAKSLPKHPYIIPQYHYVNVMNHFKSTGKLNPISGKYIKNKLYADAAAEVLYKNLDKSAIKKADFWINNGINYTSACIWRLVTLSQEQPEKFGHVATIPHLVTLMLNPIIDVVEFLLEDEEIGPLVASIKGAYENEAGSQLSGIEATAQIPFGRLYNKDFFWTFNPKTVEEEIPLNLNNPKKPIALCIANNESIKDAVGPLIGIVTNTVINVLNDSEAFHRTVLAVDELPTVFIKDLDFVPATMRSKDVVTMLSVQEYSQLERDYGKEIAKTIIGNMGNQFFGMTNDAANAKSTAEMFGEYDKLTESVSNSESGISTTESFKKEKVRQGTNIMGQNLGHFSGKIADGRPPFFSCQFEDGRIHKMLNIPEGDLLPLPNVGFPVQDNFTDFNEKMIFQKAILKELIDENFKTVIKDVSSLLNPIREARLEATQKTID
jgi:hypothetical protein